MSVSFARPDVSDLNVCVFERSIHPELLPTHERLVVAQDGFEARLAICEAGHILEFRSAHPTLTEVMAPRQAALPQRHRLIEKRLRGSRDEQLRFPGGLVYLLSYQVEQLDPEVFRNLHDEFSADCRKATLGHIFATANRLSPAAISFLQIDLFPQSLLVHAFHTFPDTCSIAKSQTLIELYGAAN